MEDRTLTEGTLTVNVALARDRLAELRAGISALKPSTIPKESLTAIEEIQNVLDKLVSRHVLLREVLHRTSDIMFTKDLNGRYTMINGKGAHMLGKAVDEVLGVDDTSHYPPSVAAGIMGSDREVMDSGRPATRDLVHDVEGVQTHMVTTTTTWYDERGDVQGVIGIAQDVTAVRIEALDSKHQLGRLRALSTEVVLREEELRKTLAAELQNGLGQELALAKLKLAVLRAAADAKLREELTGIEALVDQADQSLHAITFQICPPSLHDLGLIPALEWLGEEIGRRYGLAVDILDEDTPAVADGRVRVIMFRAVRELLVNVARHAATSHVEVHAGVDLGQVVVTVRDLGVGFKPTEMELKGMGLFGIREQMRYLGGDMHLVSNPGQGTSVSLRVPHSATATHES